MAKMALTKPPAPHLHPTYNSIAPEQRARLVELLQVRLADAIDLMLTCKQAHWTIKGPHFIALHELFDVAHNDARGYVDDIAERAAALGGHVVGTPQHVGAHSTLPPYPVETTDGLAHAAALARTMAAFAKQTREAIGFAEAHDDAVTADLFTSMTREVDKRMWMVEAHIQRS